MRLYKKVFPRLTEITASCRQDLGCVGETFGSYEQKYYLVKITIMVGSRWNYFPALVG